MNRTLASRLYNISRPSLIRWEKDGVYLGRLAKLGIAIDPGYIEEFAKSIDTAKFDNLSSFPPRELSKEEKLWFQVCFSYPNGPIMDPRPREGAPKGVYYDEKYNKWVARPFVSLPSAP